MVHYVAPQSQICCCLAGCFRMSVPRGFWSFTSQCWCPCGPFTSFHLLKPVRKPFATEALGRWPESTPKIWNSAIERVQLSASQLTASKQARFELPTSSPCKLQETHWQNCAQKDSESRVQEEKNAQWRHRTRPCLSVECSGQPQPVACLSGSDSIKIKAACSL